MSFVWWSRGRRSCSDHCLLGGPTAAVIARHNPGVRVTVVDRDESRIKAWKGRHLPIHEPGLIDIVRGARDGILRRRRRHAQNDHSGTWLESRREPNLFFSTNCAQKIAEADIVFLSVNTPTKRRGAGAGRATDMTAVEGAVKDIALNARPGTIIVEKSTVPCKTGQLIKNILDAYRPGVVFPVLSNPEFLSEGTAIRDLMQPDRVIIGCESTLSGHRAAAALANLYASWVPRSKIAPINIWSSELCKLAANAMLAQRISSINSISAICERTGADITEIAKSIGMDNRIGPQFLKAGLGFGGSCFRKDIASLTYLAESLGLPEVAVYWQQVLTMNDFQRNRFANQVISSLNNTLRRKKIAILGYAFKKNTGDARESPALDVIRILLEEGPAEIAIFDPLCSREDIKRELGALDAVEAVQIHSSPYSACASSSAILILTDWDMFKTSAPPAAPKRCPEVEMFNGVTPTSLLNMQQKPGSMRDLSSKPPTPPDTPLMSSISCHDTEEIPLPQPSCPAHCPQCIVDANGHESTDLSTAIDWPLIAKSVSENWIFDGRGILDARIMSKMGFRLETLGTPSMYS